MKRPIAFCAASAALVLSLPLTAQRGTDLVERDPEAAPVRRALEKLGPEAVIFNQHVVTLANPFMEGRVPGSRGMEIAREYFEFYLKQAGAEPAFPVAGDEDRRSYRQDFPLSGTMVATAQGMCVGEVNSDPDREFTVLGLGGSGKVTAPVVFAGYGVESGPDDYTSFPGDEDLAGKIAMIFRYEPMDAEGRSKWSDRGPWTRNGNFSTKVQNALRRHAAGVIFVNPPGADDPRANQLTKAGQGGRRGRSGGEIPVVHVSDAAAERLLAEIAPAGTTLAALRQSADAKGEVIEFGGEVTLESKLERDRIIGQNVGGVIPGKGALKDEWIVIGGHLDHLGIGLYGARNRDRVGELHPGADDNASGSAAILMLAESLNEAYGQLPDGTPARSILLVGFDAEEAGLHGSRHYVDDPIAPIEKHALMINFDMIGRIVNKRLSLSGWGTAEGMEEWLDPLLEKSPLDVVKDPAMGPGGSDHFPFNAKKVPFLFGIIKDFHPDYHTPDDVSWKINNGDAVHTVHLFHDIALTAATHTGPFEYKPPSNRR